MNPDMLMPDRYTANPGYHTTPAIVAIVADTDSEHMAHQAAALAGARIAASTSFADATERLAQQVAVDIILIEASNAGAAALETVIAAVLATASDLRSRIVAVFTEAQIDTVAAQLLGSDVQLLCEPTLGERVAALATAGRGERPAFHDATREAETSRLQRLNDEVARIAETLARLTRGEADDGPDGSVRDGGLAYGVPPMRDVVKNQIDPSDVREVIRLRRLRSQYFQSALFADPTWDMLLDLFAAELEHVRVSVSSLCIAADVPPTTALRWITTMTEEGLFARHADPHDRRRAYIALTATAREAMSGYFTALNAAGPANA